MEISHTWARVKTAFAVVDAERASYQALVQVHDWRCKCGVRTSGAVSTSADDQQAAGAYVTAS